MAQPTPYDRQFSFQDFQAQEPTTPLPGDEVDTELNSVKLTLDQTLTNLARIQRDDGALKNGIVTQDSLSPSLSIGFTMRGEWAGGVNYILGDGVTHVSKFYRARVSHLSVGGQPPDMHPELWEELADFESLAVDAAESAAEAAASATAAAGSASSASANASSAASSATSATGSASSATGSASAASASASAAASSASAASASASTAAASAASTAADRAAVEAAPPLNSTFINWTQNGTGAVQRSVADKLYDFISVKDFGATGDGTTDDTAAIRAAIVAARGGTLYFPRGVYFVEELSAPEIFLLDQSIRLIGDGGSIEGSWIKVSADTPNTIDFFHIVPAQASIPFVKFSGLHISPETPETYVGGRHAIHIETDADSQLQRFVIEDCWINAGAGYAIKGQDTDVTVSTAAYYQSVVQRNVLFGNLGGIHFTECGDSVTIADNVFVGAGRAIYIKAVDGAAQQVIERNGFQGTPLGAILLEDCNQAKIRDCQIEQGVTYAGTEGGMVVLNNCTGCEITGSNLNGFNQVAPVRLLNGSNRNRIERNSIAIASSSSRHAIVNVDSGTMNVFGASNKYLINNAVAEPLVEVGINPQVGTITKLTTFNSWADTGSGWSGLYYRANEDDTVSLFGAIAGGLTTSGANIAQLPVGIRPSKSNLITAWCDSNVSALLSVGTDGAIAVAVALPSSAFLAFTEARYPTA